MRRFLSIALIAVAIGLSACAARTARNQPATSCPLAGTDSCPLTNACCATTAK